MNVAETAPISPKTVTVLGSHWPDRFPWSGFDWSRAELRSGDDYHLEVPWMHPDDIAVCGWQSDMEGIYRIRLKRGWRSFAKTGGVWLVSKEPPQEQALYGTPPHLQANVIVVELT